MSKSAIYTVNSTTTMVSPGEIIPLGSTVRRFGCNITQDGNTITLSGRGYYQVTATATVSPTAAGDVGISLVKDGVPIASASATVAAATDLITIPTTAIVRNLCDCNSSTLTFILNTTESDVIDFSVTVVKL